MRRLLGLVVAAVAATLLISGSAQATFPGQNGRIAYVRDGQIWAMNADGSGQAQVTSEAGNVCRSCGPAGPSWSPVAPRMAYSFDGSIYVINADGTGRLRIASGRQPSWS